MGALTGGSFGTLKKELEGLMPCGKVIIEIEVCGSSDWVNLWGSPFSSWAEGIEFGNTLGLVERNSFGVLFCEGSNGIRKRAEL